MVKYYSLDNFILIHLDEKWIDIKNINTNLYDSIIMLQKETDKKIIIYAFDNSHKYFINFETNLNKFKPNNIFLIKNLDIFMFERFINSSVIALSCHSGYLVQISGYNKANVLDLINCDEKLWVSCWIPPNDNYKQIYKDKNKLKLSITEIMQSVKITYDKKLQLWNNFTFEGILSSKISGAVSIFVNEYLKNSKFSKTQLFLLINLRVNI